MKFLLTASIAAFAFSLIGDINITDSFNNWNVLNI
jgi:hypothetical protein